MKYLVMLLLSCIIIYSQVYTVNIRDKNYEIDVTDYTTGQLKDVISKLVTVVSNYSDSISKVKEELNDVKIKLKSVNDANTKLQMNLDEISKDHDTIKLKAAQIKKRALNSLGAGVISYPFIHMGGISIMYIRQSKRLSFLSGGMALTILVDSFKPVKITTFAIGPFILFNF